MKRLVVAFQTKRDFPFEYIKMKLIERFHWTIEEFERQPWSEIELFLAMMDIENQFQEREMKKTKIWQMKKK